MYEFAMLIWNASSDDFIKYLVIFFATVFALYEIKQEINIQRVKRFGRK